jgi:putative sigma-54 modulation protein
MNETKMTELSTHITPHHLRLSPAITEFVRNKFAKVPRIASDAIATEVVLRRHHGTSGGRRFSASARLAVAGRDIHASATHPDLYTAIVKLVARLARRSRKRKVRLVKTRAERRAAPQRALERSITLPDTGEKTNAAMPEAPRDQSRGTGGQEQRVFPFRRTAPFAFHQLFKRDVT